MKRRRRQDKHKASFEVLAHPTGHSVRVHASNWRELLRISAAAMFDLSAQQKHTSGTEPTHMFPLELEAPNYAKLLVVWLNELISLSQERSMLFSNFEVLQLDFEATCRLTAMIEGEHIQALAGRSVRAVESSALTIEETPRGLTTQIVFGI